MYLQMAGVDRGIITLNDLTPEWIFKFFLKLPDPTDAKSYLLHLNDFLAVFFAFKLEIFSLG